MQNIEDVYNAVLKVTDYKGRTNFINVKSFYYCPHYIIPDY